MKLASFFSQRVQCIFEIYLKYSEKRARKMKLASFFSQRVQCIFEFVSKIVRTREKKAGNWEIMQTVGRLFNTQRASAVVMRS